MTGLCDCGCGAEGAPHVRFWALAATLTGLRRMCLSPLDARAKLDGR